MGGNKYTSPSFPNPGFHFCATPKCSAQVKESEPRIDHCAKHLANACPACKGRGEYLYAWNEAWRNPMKFRKCKVCRGTGQIKRKTKI
jgi:DnaJ-class molecular chaperone